MLRMSMTECEVSLGTGRCQSGFKSGTYWPDSTLIRCQERVCEAVVGVTPSAGRCQSIIQNGAKNILVPARSSIELSKN